MRLAKSLQKLRDSASKTPRNAGDEFAAMV